MNRYQSDPESSTHHHPGRTSPDFIAPASRFSFDDPPTPERKHGPWHYLRYVVSSARDSIKDSMRDTTSSKSSSLARQRSIEDADSAKSSLQRQRSMSPPRSLPSRASVTRDNFAHHLDQDYNREFNPIHKLTPEEHRLAYAARKERQEQERRPSTSTASTSTSPHSPIEPSPPLPPPPLKLRGPVPRSPTVDENSMRRLAEARKFRLTLDRAFLTSLEQSILSLLETITRASYFRPLIHPDQEYLLCEPSDLRHLEYLQSTIVALPMDERTKILRALWRHLDGERRHWLTQIVQREGLKVVSRTDRVGIGVPNVPVPGSDSPFPSPERGDGSMGPRAGLEVTELRGRRHTPHARDSILQVDFNRDRKDSVAEGEGLRKRSA